MRQDDGLDPRTKAEATYALGFDVGGTDIKIGFVSNHGDLLKLPTVSTAHGGAEALIAQIQGLYDEIHEHLAQGTITLSDGSALTPAQVCPEVGVAIPGVLTEENGMTITSANLGWGRFPMRDRLSETLGVPVALGHDVRSGALGEALFTGREECFFVAIGTGIAAGVVLNRRLLNRSGTTGEIGQVLLQNPDLPYLKDTEDAPRLLPLERISSAEFTARRYARLKGITETENRPTSKDVFALEREGDEIAHHVVETATEALGFVIAASLTALGNLEVIIGGGQSKEGPQYLERIRQATNSRIVNLPETTFSLANFGSQAQLLGIGAQAFIKGGIELYPTTNPA